jgi:hypothetical protein
VNPVRSNGPSFVQPFSLGFARVALPCAALFAALSAPTAAAAAETYTLSPTYPPGRVTVSTSTVSSTTFQGGQTGQSTNRTLATQSIRANPAGGSIIDIRIDEMTMGTEGPMADASPTDAISNALVGSTYQVYVTADGHIDRVEGLDMVVDKVVAQLAADAPPEVLAGMSAGLRASLGNDANARMLEQATLALPRTPQPVGGTWSANADLELMLGVGIAMEYACTLLDVQAPLATVSCDIGGTMKLDPAAMMAQVAKLVPGADSVPDSVAKMMAEQIAASVTLERVSGAESLVFDLDNGYVVSSHSELRTALSVTGQRMEQISSTDVKNALQ